MTAPRMGRGRRIDARLREEVAAVETYDSDRLCSSCAASIAAAGDTLCASCRAEIDQTYADLPGAEA